jgi:hypothetical protein
MDDEGDRGKMELKRGGAGRKEDTEKEEYV